MTDLEIIATVIAAFFIIGAGVGIVTVLAMSAVRHGRGEVMPPRWPGDGYQWPGPGRQWPGPEHRPDEPDPGSGDGPPHWPDG